MKRTKWSRKANFGAKLPATATLRAKAWKVFGDWIKERDRHICVTCGSRNANQAGHFFHGVLDFDEQNISCQCKKCNHFLSGNLAIYASYLLNKYGLKKFQDLEQRHYLAMKGEWRSEQDYLNLIEKYRLDK
jgi:hypothetical protein